MSRSAGGDAKAALIPSPHDAGAGVHVAVARSLVDKLLGLIRKLRAVTTESEKATLQNTVTATDQQTDALVYDLYGLTEAEIKIVRSGQ